MGVCHKPPPPPPSLLCPCSFFFAAQLREFERVHDQNGDTPVRQATTKGSQPSVNTRQKKSLEHFGFVKRPVKIEQANSQVKNGLCSPVDRSQTVT